MGNCHFNNDCGYHEETGEFIFNPKIVIKLRDRSEIVNISNAQSINDEKINLKSNNLKMINQIEKQIKQS